MFGNDRAGQNYPFVFLSYSAGGIVFPMLGGAPGGMGNFPMTFSICAAACLVGTLCTVSIRKPGFTKAHRPVSVYGFIHQMHWDELEETVDHILHPGHHKEG